MFENRTQELATGWVEQLEEAARLVAKVNAELEADRLSGLDAELLVRKFTAVERLAAGGRLGVVSRYEKSNVWARNGERDPADALARITGTTKTRANAELDTGQRLEGLAATATAVREGRLSVDQAKEVAAGASKAPELEADLLDLAERGTLRELKERSRQARTAGEDEAARRARHRRQRYARHWQDADGAGHIELCDAAEEIARSWALIEAAEKKRFAAARKAGEREPRRAYLADAAAALLRRGARGDVPGDEDDFLDDGTPVNATINVLVQYEAYRRGHALAGEIAEIDGSGPITVEAIREMVGDGFVTVSLYDGVDVHRVARPGRRSAHVLTSDDIIRRVLESDGVDVKTIRGRGRNIPADLQTALIVRDRVCSEPGCENRFGLETDHVDPVGWGVNGPTTYDNLRRRCRHHHSLKTERDRQRYGHGHPSDAAEWDLDGPDPP